MAFDDHVQKGLDRALSGARGHLEADLRAFAQDLARASAEERARAVKEAADAAAADVRRQAQAQLAQLREATQKHTDELRKSADAHINELKRTIDETRRDAEQQQSETARRAQAEMAEARRVSEAELDELRKATDNRIAELTQEIAHIRKSTAAEAEVALVARLAMAATENERRVADAIERARTDSHQTVLAEAARFADAVRALDEATALGDVLETLAERAGREVDRAAVLVVKGDRLQAWRLAGFGSEAPPARSINLSLDEAGLAGAVVRTGVAVSRPAVEPGPSQERQPALPPFAQDAGTRHALALPLTVGGSVIAVLYADAPRLDTPSASSRWPALLDVLARHASRVLEAMTVQQAAGLSLPQPVTRSTHGELPGPIEHAGSGDEDAARRYARLLLSEIRMYNEPLVDAGRQSRDLLTKLGGEIDRARRLYEARVPSTVVARSDFFDQEIVRTLADGDHSLLGREL